MKVLIGCEESGVVCNAFRKRGHEAYSCDLVETRGNPDWHIQGDVMDAVQSRRWDLIILHPDCTAMAVSGNKWYGRGMPKHAQRYDAINWTLRLWDTALKHSDKVALENPVSVIFTFLNEWDVQYVQPWMFGHLEQKKTGLALHNLPRLQETKNVYEEMIKLPKNQREKMHYMSPGPNRKRDRSKTFQGIADAMAEQWE